MNKEEYDEDNKRPKITMNEESKKIIAPFSIFLKTSSAKHI